jgi:hypothetical protein
MNRRSDSDRLLALLLQCVGTVAMLAVVPLWMPREWIEVAHRWLGLGEFPISPIAEYLARSVSALCAFYGGLLVVLSFDVQRYAPLIRYQAIAIMTLSACGVVVGRWAGMPWWFVGGDAAACWAYGIPMLILVHRGKRCNAEQSDAADSR